MLKGIIFIEEDIRDNYLTYPSGAKIWEFTRTWEIRFSFLVCSDRTTFSLKRERDDYYNAPEKISYVIIT